MAINDFRPIPPAELIRAGNETTLAVAMVETPAAIERLDDLLAIGVIDAILIGTNDLSTTLGVPAQWDNPAFIQALEHVIAACKKAGIPSGIGGLFVPEILGHWVRKGMTFLYRISDGQALIQFPANQMKLVKQATGA